MTSEALLELQALATRLRSDCPWDREQTAQTIESLYHGKLEEHYDELAHHYRFPKSFVDRANTSDICSTEN